MRSTKEGKKSRLPKVLSILFGSSLVALTMASLGSPPAEAETFCNGCYMCTYFGGGDVYCSSSSPGAPCCTQNYSPGSDTWSCSMFGGWCS